MLSIYEVSVQISGSCIVDDNCSFVVHVSIARQLSGRVLSKDSLRKCSDLQCLVAGLFEE